MLYRGGEFCIGSDGFACAASGKNRNGRMTVICKHQFIMAGAFLHLKYELIGVRMLMRSVNVNIADNYTADSSESAV